ncbi:hypothetical protein C0Q70_13673 [Pomacea canaliculata]|uniref:Galactose mutarotase n=1 Tax=Pomacea canaliculata TaxID=400727 RepID=A0A2T7NXV9_POMCA|nr:hypothetical protein C0Q70_13673 [Pomacea canaliculata]
MPAAISQDNFGQTKDGRCVTRYTLSSSSGRLVVRILDYGGIITEINVPDRNGKVSDINLGLDDMADYETKSPYFGALIGRVANRIAGGRFVLDGQTYQLFINNGPNSLHGGRIGFDKYTSPDGEENYPGELTTTVRYRVSDDDELWITYEATTTKPTPVNLTNHAYFNLAGHEAGTLDDSVVTIAADTFTVVDENSIPTGEIRPVEGTEWDLRKPVRLGDRLLQVPGGRGFDHNFCLTGGSSREPKFAARVEHPPSGRFMECKTTEPGLQFYTGVNLNVPGAKGGAVIKSLEPSA